MHSGPQSRPFWLVQRGISLEKSLRERFNLLTSLIAVGDRIPFFRGCCLRQRVAASELQIQFVSGGC